MSHSATSAPAHRERLVNAALSVAALVLMVVPIVLAHESGWFSREGEGLFALGLLMVGGEIGGRLVSYVGLPRLTGYLTVGVLAGPHVFGAFSTKSVKDLTLVNGLALALIALQAGAELTTEMIRRGFKSMVASTVVQAATQPILIGAAFVLLARQLPFTRELSLTQLIALGGVWGVIALSKSPAATLALIGETRSSGPLTEHVLSVVVLLDAVVLALFALALELARTALVPEAAFSVGELLQLGQDIFASIAAGTTFGLLIALYFRLISGDKLLFVLAAGYGITAACAYLHYDTLLVFVSAGFVVTNLTRQGPQLIEACERLSTAVMVVFFATAGAKLDLEVLRQGWSVALTLVVARIAVTWLTCQPAHRFARDAEVVRRYGFLGFVSQAGVTIGLTMLAAERLPGVGAGLATLSIAVVGINELIGPILFKLGLSRAGEVGRTRHVALVEESPPGTGSIPPPPMKRTEP
ncbi:MAG: cation:proton antiporter [Deltaproteobacteria bacterium]|nr:cation:proton antiporter [Deltaproteobacteria bacterium]